MPDPRLPSQLQSTVAYRPLNGTKSYGFVTCYNSQKVVNNVPIRSNDEPATSWSQVRHPALVAPLCHPCERTIAPAVRVADIPLHIHNPPRWALNQKFPVSVFGRGRTEGAWQRLKSTTSLVANPLRPFLPAAGARSSSSAVPLAAARPQHPGPHQRCGFFGRVAAGAGRRCGLAWLLSVQPGPRIRSLPGPVRHSSYHERFRHTNVDLFASWQ